MKLEVKLELSQDWVEMRRNLRALGEWGTRHMDVCYLHLANVLLKEMTVLLAGQFTSEAPEMVKYLYRAAAEKGIVELSEDNFYKAALELGDAQQEPQIPDWL